MVLPITRCGRVRLCDLDRPTPPLSGGQRVELGGNRKRDTDPVSGIAPSIVGSSRYGRNHHLEVAALVSGPPADRRLQRLICGIVVAHHHVSCSTFVPIHQALPAASLKENLSHSTLLIEAMEREFCWHLMDYVALFSP
jgi:hypothetical protein